MHIQKLYFNTLNRYNFTDKKSQEPSVVDKNAQSFSGYCYRPILNNKVSFKSVFSLGKTTNENVQVLQKSLQSLLTPIKKDFLLMKKDAVIDYFNQFYDIEYGKMNMVVEPDFKFVFKDFRDPEFKNEQFSVRVVDLKKGEFDFAFFDEKNNLQRIKLKNNQFYLLDDAKTPLSYSQVVSMNLEEKFNDMLPVITQGVEKVDDILKGVFNNDAKGYSLFLARGIKRRFDALNEVLDNIEAEKRYVLKRSYPQFIPHPNKSAFFFKESDRMFADRFAFLPHREGDEKLFRIVQFDSDSSIKDAHLIDLKSGVFKNFCKYKIFNQKNVSVIPKNDEKLSSDEIKETTVIPILEKYYALLDDFSQYVRANSYKSAKVLLEQSKVGNYLPYNRIRQSFFDKLNYILPEGKNELTFIGSDGDSYSLKKSVIEGVNVVQVSRISEKGDVTAVLDSDSCRVLEMQSCDKFVRDIHGKIKHMPYSSDAFKIRSRVLQEFIDEAFKQNDFIKDDVLLTRLKTLQEQFAKVSQGWFSTYKNKKIEARKLFGSGFISAKGDVGGFRFAIPDKDYSIGLKPHQIGKNRFMRLTVYDNNGEIINSFLLDNFSKLVDNYCAQGNFSKDAISRVPDNIIYKTDEQIQSANFSQFLEDYLKELTKFSDFFFEFMRKK